MSSSRRQYPFHLIEPKWQKFWDESQSFRAFNPNEEIPANHPFAQRHKISGKVSATQLPPKFYILDMFPYPSGAGLHVGHPEGYTATDILARYKRAQGFNVLHPMGWDAFGLPAEQYAVKTGQHPRKTTEENIATFKRQIQSLGFSYDWSRELATTDPDYFQWTQWIFLKLYNSWFNPKTNKAEPISRIVYPKELDLPATFESWKTLTPEQREELKKNFDSKTLELWNKRHAYRDSKRLAYVSEQPVWWCEQLGTVLANEEVVDGKSEVGGFPVIRKPMRQWMLRITAYAERLIQDLATIDWTDSLKEMQRNWLGRSEGAEVDFEVVAAVCDRRTGADTAPLQPNKIRVFTTRPDTLFGATYMVLAPEHKLVDQIMPSVWPGETPVNWKGGLVNQTSTLASRSSAAIGKSSTADDKCPATVDQTSAFIAPREGFANPKEAVAAYRAFAAGKSDLERTELAKEKSGIFTGAYAINPVNGAKIPIWIADYVLASYGTGAIMAVPAHDERDMEFAKKYNLKIISVVGSTTPLSSFSHSKIGYKYPLNEGELKVVVKGEEIFVFYSYARCFSDEGIAINSANIEISLNGLPTPEAKKKITAWLEEKNLGKKTINYKLRDWLFSRQRYWGEPFPIVWKIGPDGESYHEALPESALPVLPPTLEDYKPTATGEPPLARAKDWVNLPDGSVRETNTMPQWAGSCWYYLRYLDARRSESFCGTMAEHYWMGAQTSGLLLSDAQWKTRLSELLAAPQTVNRAKRYITYAVVGDEEAITLKNATGLDLQNFRRFIDDQAIAHILNEHGDPKIEESRGQLAVTSDDIALIPLVVTNPDSVRHAGKTRRHLDAIFYEKRINGFLCCVEEVREGAGLLAVKTFYKRKATGAYAVSSLNQTSETFRRSESNKTENSPQVKPTPGVDLYVGGTEHAVLHLLYARFWHKVLFDLGYVSTPEPFFKLVNQGLILGEDGQKMSKSRGNVVNPDDVLGEYGADAFRLYEMFMGPLEMVKPWNTKGVEGVYRFLGRVWRLFVDEKSEIAFEQAEALATEAQRHGELLDLILLDGGISEMDATPAQLKALHACIKKVTEDLDGLRFNTAISAMMVFINEAMTWQTKPLSVMKTFLQLLAPFAPHLAEELWARLHATFGQTAPSLAYAPWPKFDAALLVESEIEIPVQVNGKLRDVIKVSVNATQADLEMAAKNSEKVKPFIEGKTIRKIIVVPKKMVNLIVG